MLANPPNACDAVGMSGLRDRPSFTQVAGDVGTDPTARIREVVIDDNVYRGTSD